MTKRPDHIAIHADAKVGSDTVALHESLVGVWSKVLDELDKQVEGISWEFLVVEFVTQSGAFYVYPASESTVETEVPKFSVRLTVDKWATDYDKLPETKNAAQFEKAYKRSHQARLDALRRGIQDKRVESRFAKLKRPSA